MQNILMHIEQTLKLKMAIMKILTNATKIIQPVLVDDKDIETPNIPLKITSIFQILCYTTHSGKIKTSPHITNSKAILEK